MGLSGGGFHPLRHAQGRVVLALAEIQAHQELIQRARRQTAASLPA